MLRKDVEFINTYIEFERARNGADDELDDDK